MPVKKDSIDITAKDWERYKKLKEIIEMILEDQDAGDDKKDKRRWILWHFLYIIWMESSGATTRKQGGGGPARGVMQMEPRTLWDVLKWYVLGKTKGLVANLAKAAGVSEKEMREAIDDFVNNNSETYTDPDTGKQKKRGKNSWPQSGAGKKIEKWLLEIDSFGIKLMRYYFKTMGTSHSFPPADKDYKKDCKSDAVKDEHANGWAKWWKKVFGSDEEKKKKLKDFKGWAAKLDAILKKCEEEEKKKTSKKKKTMYFIGAGAAIGIGILVAWLYLTGSIPANMVTESVQVINVDELGNCIGLTDDGMEVSVGKCGAEVGQKITTTFNKPT